MRFLFPSLFLAWVPLVLVPLLLYLFRPRPKTVRTSTLPFFKWLAREHQDSTWLRWLKHLLSLLLSILVIVATAAALGRLVIAPSAGSLSTVVVLVDRSASMAAKNQDESRLDDALARIQLRLDGLSEGVGVIVMAYDRRPEVLLSRSLDRRAVRRALAKIEVRPTSGNPEEALRLARQLAALETPASIWHATDQNGEDRAANNPVTDDPETTDEVATDEVAKDQDSAENRESEARHPAVTVEHLNVALKQPLNVGITAFQLRRLPLERARFEAFVQIHCTASKNVETVDANLDIKLDGTLIAPRKLTLRPGAREKLLIPLDAEQDVEKVLSLELSVADTEDTKDIEDIVDALDLDNVVHARIPPLRPVRVLWISESPDPFTKLALASLGMDSDLEVLQGPPSAWPPEEPVDVVIFDGWLPKKWPTKVSVILVNPPGPLGPVRAVRIDGGGVPVDSVRSPAAGHPVLYGVATGRIAVTQTTMLDSSGPLESLWMGPEDPLLLAGEIRGQRILVMGFNPQDSEQLPFMASYPLLIGNAMYWAAETEIESAQGMNRRTGEFVELGGTTLTWTQPGDENEVLATQKLESRSVQLDRIGLWETETGESGSASLLSEEETLIGTIENDQLDVEADSAGSLLRGDLVPILLWGVLALLITESWLFHRYLAY